MRAPFGVIAVLSVLILSCASYISVTPDLVSIKTLEANDVTTNTITSLTSHLGTADVSTLDATTVTATTLQGTNVDVDNCDISTQLTVGGERVFPYKYVELSDTSVDLGIQLAALLAEKAERLTVRLACSTEWWWASDVSVPSYTTFSLYPVSGCYTDWGALPQLKITLKETTSYAGLSPGMQPSKMILGAQATVYFSELYLYDNMTTGTAGVTVYDRAMFVAADDRSFFKMSKTRMYAKHPVFNFVGVGHIIQLRWVHLRAIDGPINAFLYSPGSGYVGAANTVSASHIFSPDGYVEATDGPNTGATCLTNFCGSSNILISDKYTFLTH